MRRLLPLLVPIAISIALAAGLQAGMSGAVPFELAQLPAPTSHTVVALLSDGERQIECETTRDRLAADQLELNPEDLPTVAVQMCQVAGR